MIELTPYYQDDAVTIYHGDWREILPNLPPVDLVLTDPPYGIAHPTNYAERGRSTKGERTDYQPVHGDNEPFDPAPILELSERVIMWGANYYASRLPETSGWLVWDKRTRNDKGTNDQADGELAWTNCVKGVRIYRHMWNGMWRDSERGEHYHPTQKPVVLMAWALGKVPEGRTILDPFMGAGPVLRAAKDLGRKAIGIEIEERYCEIAANRMSQMVLV